MCEDERILYRMISGLHCSISSHLSRFYKDVGESRLWADLREGQVQFRFN